MSTLFTPPPPIPVVYGGSLTPTAVDITPPPHSDTSSPSSSVLIVILIIASAVIVSAAIYLLLRFLSNRFHRTFFSDAVSRNHTSSNQNPDQLKCHVSSNNDFSDSLPIFTFGSVTGNLTGGDCAVCLSKFERRDKLRLLPLCCHAFHAACIDAWLVFNRTCPLCRSTVLPSASDALEKILNRGNSTNTRSTNRDAANSGSFRIEIGSVSRRGGVAAETIEGPPRSYSIGSFEYVLDDNGYEVSLDSTTSIDKELSFEIPVAETTPAAAVEVSGRRNWLREYVDRLTWSGSVSSSHTMSSFRSSGRFFSGSSRRSEATAVVVPEDLEANRIYGEEDISELFRWLSGV